MPGAPDRSSRRFGRRGGVLTSVAEEGLSAIALVKAFAREPYEQERFLQASTESLGVRLRSVRTRTVFTPLIELLATVGTVLVLSLIHISEPTRLGMIS